MTDPTLIAMWAVAHFHQVTCVKFEVSPSNPGVCSTWWTQDHETWPSSCMGDTRETIWADWARWVCGPHPWAIICPSVSNSSRTSDCVCVGQHYSLREKWNHHNDQSWFCGIWHQPHRLPDCGPNLHFLTYQVLIADFGPQPDLIRNIKKAIGFWMSWPRT